MGTASRRPLLARRLGRLGFTAASVLSLVLCVGCIVLWKRSYTTGRMADTGDALDSKLVSVVSEDGQLEFALWHPDERLTFISDPDISYSEHTFLVGHVAVGYLDASSASRHGYPAGKVSRLICHVDDWFVTVLLTLPAGSLLTFSWRIADGSAVQPRASAKPAGTTCGPRRAAAPSAGLKRLPGGLEMLMAWTNCPDLGRRS